MSRPDFLRKWVLVALVGCSALVAAQDQPKVSFSKPVMRASDVLKELSAQSGVYLASDPVVGNIPVLVSVTDASVLDVMNKIAVAVGGELKEENGGWRLVNSDRLRREQAAKELGWVVQAFDRAKKQMAANGSASPDRWDDATLDKLVSAAQERQRALQERLAASSREGQRIQVFDSSTVSATPASSSARRALDQLPSSVLASVLPGDRIVYSSAPNRMQRRMPFNITPIVNDFVYNHNLLAKRAQDLPNNQNMTIVGGLTPGEPIQGVAETHLILSRGYRSTTISVEVKFYDRNGLMIGQGSSSITPEYTSPAQSTSGEGKVIELSELSRQFAQLMAQETASPSGARNMMRIATVDGGTGAFVTLGSGESSLPKQVPDDLLAFLTNPEKNDPTSLYVSEAYMQVAKAEGKNLVAAFPDRTVRDMARGFVAGNVTTKTVLGSSGAYGLTVEETEGWLLVTPTWADNTRKTNFNREQTGKLLRSVNTRGFATLEELADYSFYITLGLPDRPLDMVYLGLVNKDTASTLDEYVGFSLDLLRLYAVLPAQMKRAAGEQVQAPFRTLGAQARGYAEHAYYARPTGFVMPGGFSGEARFTAVMAIEAGGRENGPPPNSIMTEPTEALPNGIPGEALITLSRTLREGVFASTRGLRGGSLMSAEELGMRQGMLQANFSGGGGPPDYDTYLPAQIMNIEIAVELAEYGRPTAMFKDGWIVTGARAVGYGQLSETFRAQVEAFRQQMNVPPLIERRAGGGGGG